MKAEDFIRLATQGDEDAARAALYADASMAAARDAEGVSVVSKLVYAGRLALACELAATRDALDVFEASCVGDLERVRVLAGSLDSLDTASPDGFSPLGYAAYFGHESLLEFLLSAGADCEAASKNPMQVRPLHSAAAHRDPALAVQLAALLLEAGADPNARQQQGFAPLHEAVLNRNVPLVGLLLRHGADPEQKNDAGDSPASLARAGEGSEIVALIEAAAPR